MRMWRTRIGLIITLALVLHRVLRSLLRAVRREGRHRRGDEARRASSTCRRCSVPASSASTSGRASSTAGSPILITAFLATSFALVFGTIIGLVAAYNRGKLDDVLMRTMDVILAFPQIILALLVISMFGATNTLIILTVGVSTVPRIARVVRGSAVSVVERDFVSAAEALGESRWRILRSELLPERVGAVARRGQLAAHVLDRRDRRHRLPRFHRRPGRRELGPDDQREPWRVARQAALGRRSCPSSPSPCSRSAPA